MRIHPAVYTKIKILTPLKEAAKQPRKPRQLQPAVSSDQLLAWMKAQGDKEINPTAIRDAFKLKNRAAARRMLKVLEKDGKVKTTETGEEGKRKQFTYELV